VVTKTKKPPKERKNQFDPVEIEAKAASGETGIAGDPLLPGESLAPATETLEAPPADEPPPPDEPPAAEAVADAPAVVSDAPAVEAPAVEAAAAPVEAPAVVETPATAVVTQSGPVYAPPSAKERAISEIQDRLCEQHLILLDAISAHESAHKEASELKKEMEAEQKRLNALVQELSDATKGNYTPSLPFEDRPLPDYGFKPLGADPQLTEPAPEAAPEPWRAATLAEIGIKGKLAETLEGAGLSTLGAITDYTAQDKRLTDIPGIGEGKAVKIADLCADYFKTHPQPSAEETSEAPPVEAVAHATEEATPESSEPDKPAEPIVLDMSKAIEFTPEIRLTRHASGVITTVEAADGWRGGWSGQCRGGMKKVPLDADRKPYDARWKAVEEQVDELAEWLSGIGENAAAVEAGEGKQALAALQPANFSHRIGEACNAGETI